MNNNYPERIFRHKDTWYMEDATTSLNNCQECCFDSFCSTGLENIVCETLGVYDNSSENKPYPFLRKI